MKTVLLKMSLTKSCKSFIFFILLATTITAKGQETAVGNDENLKDQAVGSWANANRGIQYNSINNVDLHTGTLRVAIPIYTYKDKDFTLPISLTYTATGYKPNVHASYIGLGWTLNSGGSITREIRGNDDFKPRPKEYDLDVVNPDHTFYKIPFWGVDSLSKDNIKNNNYISPNIDITQYVYQDAYYTSNPDEDNINYGVGYGLLYLQNEVETVPDIFHFNFLGHRGKLIMGHGNTGTKEWVAFDTNHPHGEYKIEYSDEPLQHYIYSCDGRFFITTGDGYKYTFTSLGITNETATEWMLTKIEAPNGRKVELWYEGYQGERTYQPLASTEQIVWGYQNRNKSIGNDYWDAYRIAFHTIRRLWYIEIDNDLKIYCRYSEREKKEEAVIKSPSISGIPKLDSIIVTTKESNIPIKRCLLSYKYLGVEDGNYLMFLDSVYLSGEGSYTMSYSYDGVTRLPKHGERCFDHWGFWNDNSGSILPEKASFQARDPYHRQNCHLMLTELHYPTGGYSSYKYVPHSYSMVLKRKQSNKNYPRLEDETGQAGGLAIEQIITYPKVGSVKDAITRTFYYRNPLNGKSTGILLRSPIYRIEHPDCRVKSSPEQIGNGKYKLNVTNQYYTRQTVSSNGLVPYPKDGSHIEYTMAEERLSNNGHTRYYFSTYVNTPDMIGDGGSLDYFEIDNEAYPYINNLKKETYSMAYMRGKLLRKEVYDGDDNDDAEYKMLSVETYEYNSSENGEYWEVLPALSQFYKHRIQTGSCLLKKHVKTLTYRNMLDEIITEQEYRYNDAGQLIATQSITKEGEVLKTLIRHVGQTAFYDPFTFTALYPESILSPAEIQMVADNMIKFPSEVITHKRYSIGRSNYKLARHTYGKGSANAPYTLLKTEESIGNADSYESAKGLLSPNFIVKSTDNLGNPLEVWSRKEGTITNIWGYGGLHLVATVQNATLAMIKQIPSLGNIDIAPLTGDVSSSLRQTLENINSSNVLVTTYTYKPHIGLTSITDPSGRSQSYHYDRFGRLELLKYNGLPKQKITYSVNQ